MKGIITVILSLLVLSGTAAAQKTTAKPRSPAQEYILKKQIFVDDIESSLGAVPYAAVRIRIRYELATWLWKKGPDDTGRAEALAVRAIEELYEKVAEVEHPEWIRSDLFTLLEKNAKDTAARLKAKFFTTAEDDLENAAEIIDEKDGDKEVARRLIKAITAGGDFGWRISSLLRELSNRNSPELTGVVSALIAAENSGRLKIDNVSIDFILDTFTPEIPESIRKTYFMLIIGRARDAIRTPGVNSDAVYYTLRNAVSKLGQSAPDLIPEAEALMGSLHSRFLTVSTEMREINERILASDDKLATIMREAAGASTVDMRTKLYIRAEELALEQNNFPAAIEAIETLREVNKGQRDIFFITYPDQEFAIIARKALSKSAEEFMLKAIGKITDDIRRAELWREAAVFYYDRKNALESEDALNKSFKLLADADREKPARAHALLKLIPVVAKIAKPRLQETIVLTTKAINDLPTPGPDDKPGTEGFKKFIITAGALIYNIKPAMEALLKNDMASGEEFAGRLQKREVRVMADMLIGLEKLESSRPAPRSTR